MTEIHTETAVGGSAGTPTCKGADVIPFDIPEFGLTEPSSDADDRSQAVADILASTRSDADEPHPVVVTEEPVDGPHEWAEHLQTWQARLTEAEESQDDGARIVSTNAVLRYQWLLTQHQIDTCTDEHTRRTLQTAADRIDTDLVTANLGLAHSIASRFSRVAGDWRSDIDAEAVAELISVIRRWDPSKATLASYAMKYVSKAAKKQVIFFERPQQTYGEFTAAPDIAAAEQRIIDQARSRGERPALDDRSVAEHAGVSASVVAGVRARRPVSLDTPVGDDGSATLADLVASQAAEPDRPGFDPDVEWSRQFVRLASTMNAVERFAVIRRGGLDGRARQTIAQIAGWLERGREDVRALLGRADTKAAEAAEELLARHGAAPSPGIDAAAEHASRILQPV